MDNTGDPFLLRRNLLAEGRSDSEIRASKRGKFIVPLRRGVYLPAEELRGATHEQRHALEVKAALHSSSSALVVSHQSAAVLHGAGMWNPDLRRTHFTIDRASGGHRAKNRHIHSGPIDPADIVVLDGVRATSLARTAADLAHTLNFEEAVSLGDSAIRLGASHADIVRMIDLSRRHGVASARRAAQFLTEGSDSVGESRSRVFLRTHGFPEPELQVTLREVNGSFIARVDFLFDRPGVIGEFDGKVKYSKFLQPGETVHDVVLREKQREDRLRAHGWIVVRWTWADLAEPERLIARLRMAFDMARDLPEPRTVRRMAS